MTREELKRHCEKQVEGDTGGRSMTYEEAWQELKESITELRDNDGTGTQQEICKFLANLMGVLDKQITDGWVSCSERLPEDSGEYLVTVIDEDDETYRHTGIAWYAHPKHYDIKDGEWRELMINEIVVAWMPLPREYKAETESET